MSGTAQECYPFGFGAPDAAGVYVVYLTNDGPAARAGNFISSSVPLANVINDGILLLAI